MAAPSGRGGGRVRAVQPFGLRYGQLEGWDSPTALIPIAPLEDEEQAEAQRWLCCLPINDETPDDDEVEIATSMGRMEVTYFAVVDLSGVRLQKSPMLRSITFDLSSRAGDHLTESALLDACPLALRELAGIAAGGAGTEEAGSAAGAGGPETEERGDRTSQSGRQETQTSTNPEESSQRATPFADDGGLNAAARAFFHQQTSALVALGERLAALSNPTTTTHRHVDLKGRTFEGFHQADRPTGKPLLDDYRTAKWAETCESMLKQSYPSDAPRFHGRSWEAARKAALAASKAMTHKTKPHHLLKEARSDSDSDEASKASGAVSRVSSIFGNLRDKVRLRAERIGQYGPAKNLFSSDAGFTATENERDDIIDAFAAPAYRAALPVGVVLRAQSVFGENPTTSQYLYTHLLTLWSRSKDQRRSAKKEMDTFKAAEGETVHEALDRFKAYVQRAKLWGVRLPDLSDAVAIVGAVVYDREQLLPHSVKLSLDQFRMETGLDDWDDGDGEDAGDGSWDDLLIWCEILQAVFLEHPHETDVKKKSAAFLSQEKTEEKGVCFKCKQPGHLARDCPNDAEKSKPEGKSFGDQKRWLPCDDWIAKQNFSEQEKQRYLTWVREKVQCQKCGQIGHAFHDCPHDDQSAETNGENQPGGTEEKKKSKLAKAKEAAEKRGFAAALEGLQRNLAGIEAENKKLSDASDVREGKLGTWSGALVHDRGTTRKSTDDLLNEALKAMRLEDKT
jgi:hypothetical protein